MDDEGTARRYGEQGGTMTTVDGDLFDSLPAAIEFVSERGGGVVYTPIAGSLYVKSLKLPHGVEIKAVRPPNGGA